MCSCRNDTHGERMLEGSTAHAYATRRDVGEKRMHACTHLEHAVESLVTRNRNNTAGSLSILVQIHSKSFCCWFRL